MFDRWARELALGFNGPRNQALYGGMARVIGDRTLDDAQAMVTESLPLVASPTANGLTANDRVLVKGPAESDASFAARLVAYVDQWRLASTPVGLLIQLYYVGFSGAVVVQQNGLAHYLSGAPKLDELAVFVANWQARTPTAFPAWYVQVALPAGNPSIPASADGKAAIPVATVSWWNFDSDMDSEGNQFCGRFALLFPASTSPGLGTAATLARLRRLVADWKPGARLCVGFYVCTAGVYWDWPTGLWDDTPGDTWDASSVTFYAAE